MESTMRVALPDLVSNSYFPAIAAADLGFFQREGLDAEIELLFPVPKTMEGLRDGRFAFVAGAAHAVLTAFPEWRGARLLAALAQHTYWLLVVRADRGVRRGDLQALRGLRPGAWHQRVGLVRRAGRPGAGRRRDRRLLGQCHGRRGGRAAWRGHRRARRAPRRRSPGRAPLHLPPASDHRAPAGRAAARRRGRRTRPGGGPAGVARRSRAGNRGGAQAVPPRGGRADRRADPPRRAVLRPGNFAGDRGAAEPVRPGRAAVDGMRRLRRPPPSPSPRGEKKPPARSNSTLTRAPGCGKIA